MEEEYSSNEMTLRAIHSIGRRLLRACFAGIFFSNILFWPAPGRCAALSSQDGPDTTGGRLLSFSESHPINARFGPLHLRGQSPFQLLRLSLIPVGVDRLEQGRWLINATATWTNRWAWKEGQYLVDAEILRMAVSATYGVTDWMQIRLEIPFCVRGGGALDGLIMGFHDTFGYTQAGRDQFPKNEFHIVFWRKNGTKFELDSSHAGAGLEDVVLSSIFRLTRGGRWVPHTCLTAHLKMPTGNEKELFGSGSLDGGLALCLTKRIWKLYGYLGVQYTRFGGDSIAGIPMRNDQVSMLSALEVPLNSRFSLLAQYLLNSGSAEDFYEFSESTHEVALGAKGEVFRNTVFEFALIENVLHYDNSPDFGIHFGVSRGF